MALQAALGRDSYETAGTDSHRDWSHIRDRQGHCAAFCSRRGSRGCRGPKPRTGPRDCVEIESKGGEAVFLPTELTDEEEVKKMVRTPSTDLAKSTF